MAALRIGSEFGRHTVLFDGEDDVVELTHTARGRNGFASGAVRAAEWIVGRRGMLTLDELKKHAAGGSCAVVAAAGGRDKVSALEVALRNGFVNVFVTDLVTARLLLEAEHS